MQPLPEARRPWASHVPSFTTVAISLAVVLIICLQVGPCLCDRPDSNPARKSSTV